MASYYYFIAQLPSLAYGASAPMSSSAYVELCGELMPESDRGALKLCTLALPEEGSGASDSALIEAWRTWEKALRLNLAKLRAARLKRDSSSLEEAPLDPLDAVAVARAAMACESPLEAELLLDKARWDFIERAQGSDYFSRETAYAYLFKLQLLERRAQFRVEEGYEEYKNVYASVMNDASISIASGEAK